jgi:ring-1,2-phenylacetyl-CoA epoxidase subunit PaaD
MMSVEAVYSVLRTVLDPEMPINIVDLGIVADVRVLHDAVEVDVTPTFVGCPALDVLRQDIGSKLRTAGAGEARVRYIHEPPWSVERISDAGRAALRAHGVTVPAHGSVDAAGEAALVPLTISGVEAIACPYCGSQQTRQESRFGPTRCRMIYYCDACRNQFEHMKAI